MPPEIKKKRLPIKKKPVDRTRLERPKDSEKKSSRPCPQCGSFSLRRSHSRGLYEQLLKYIHQRAYRCKDCGWRGYVNSKGRQSRRTSSSKGYTVGRMIFIVVALLITLYLLFYLVDWAHQDSGGQTQSSAFKGSGTIGG